MKIIQYIHLFACFLCLVALFSIYCDAIYKNQQQIKQLTQQVEDLNQQLNIYGKEVELLHSNTDAMTAELATYNDTINTLTKEVEELKIVKEVNEVELHKEAFTDVGTYELTAYIATGNPCADGAYPQVGYTVACNDSKLWHKWIHIDGYGDFYVHDTGGMASNVIDIFVGSYDEAIQFGRKSASVSIITKE